MKRFLSHAPKPRDLPLQDLIAGYFAANCRIRAPHTRAQYRWALAELAAVRAAAVRCGLGISEFVRNRLGLGGSGYGSTRER